MGSNLDILTKYPFNLLIAKSKPYTSPSVICRPSYFPSDVGHHDTLFAVNPSILLMESMNVLAVYAVVYPCTPTRFQPEENAIGTDDVRL